MGLFQDSTQMSIESHSPLDFEEIFLGAIISGVTDSEEITKVGKGWFYGNETKILYEVISRLHTEFGWVDFLSVTSELAKHTGLEKAKQYINKIIGKVPAEFSPSQAIEIIEESFIRRSAVAYLDTAKKAIQVSPRIATEVVHSLLEKVEKLSEYKGEFDLTKEFESTVERIITGSGERIIIPTGIKSIDRLIGGLSTQEITIIAGRPGHGKTTISVGLTKSILDENPGKIVVKFELEMSKESIKRKFISLLSGVSSYKIRIGDLSDEERRRITEAVEQIKKYENRLYIYDNIYDLPTMNKICKSLKADVCMVDFITLMDGVEDDKRNELGRIVMQAKRFAKAHNMVYIFFSQLNRGPESREGHRPQMSDLAESDQLTQLASEIILLFYKFKYSFDPADQKKLWFIFDKARFSNIGDVKIYFDPDLALLREY